MALVDRPYSCNGIEHRGFSGAVAADHGNKVSVFQRQAHIFERPFLIYRSRIECFRYVFYLQHLMLPPC